MTSLRLGRNSNRTEGHGRSTILYPGTMLSLHQEKGRGERYALQRTSTGKDGGEQQAVRGSVVGRPHLS